MPNNKLIIFELNEIPYRVIDGFVTDRPDSSFGKIMATSARFNVKNTDKFGLHPKTSWQTFHRGVNDEAHGIVEFNQNEPESFKNYPNFWDILRENGMTVGCGASIGSYPLPANWQNIDFYLPQFCSPTSDAYPSYLEAFQKFNASMSRASGRVVRRSISILDAVRLIPNWFDYGFSSKMIFKIAKQLFFEQFIRRRIVRRRSIQSLLSFEVCMKQVRRFKPDAVTIFSNHVASSMHRYWAAKYEKDYDNNNMSKKWRSDYKDEIDYAMLEADYMLQELVDFVQSNPEYRIMILGSMGQEGVEFSKVHNQLVVRDMNRFLNEIGIFGFRVLHGMEPRYIVELYTPDEADRLVATLKNIKIDGTKPDVLRINDLQVSFEVSRNNTSIKSIEVNGEERKIRSLGLKVEPIQDFAPSTAQHVPEGACLVFSPGTDISALSCDERFPITQVTASILESFGCEVPEYMPRPNDKLYASLS